MLTGTKIALTATLWSYSLTTFIVIYGVVKYGSNPEYWRNVAGIIGALLASNTGVYGFNEWRKRYKPYNLNEGDDLQDG